MNSAHSFVRTTRDYEAWLASQVRAVRADLQAKHKLMAENGFSFLRATSYRWAQLFPALFPKLARAQKLFGGWRFARRELRHLARRRVPAGLGINDFDEACPLPYTNDLVRLATSAWLAIEGDELALGRGAACRVILEGYAAALQSGGRAVVLSEHNRMEFGWVSAVNGKGHNLDC